jgi:hypothetical protein
MARKESSKPHEVAIAAVVLVLGLFFVAGVVPVWAEDEDPPATMSWERDPFGLRDYVNDRAKRHKLFKVIPEQYLGAGALNYDSVTAAKVCAIACYRKVESMGCVSNYNIHPLTGEGRCGWWSCGDNINAKWNESAKDFDLLNACSVGNKWLTTLVCSERIEGCDDRKDSDIPVPVPALSY